MKDLERMIPAQYRFRWSIQRQNVSGVMMWVLFVGSSGTTLGTTLPDARRTLRSIIEARTTRGRDWAAR